MNNTFTGKKKKKKRKERKERKRRRRGGGEREKKKESVHATAMFAHQLTIGHAKYRRMLFTESRNT